MILLSELNKKNVSNQQGDDGLVDQSNKELILNIFIKDYTNKNNFHFMNIIILYLDVLIVIMKFIFFYIRKNLKIQ